MNNNVGSFIRDRPTIVMLHPLFLDSSWLQSHFDDPRLASEYNIIAFDQRTMGRSRCRPSELHDSYVDAADLAHAIQVPSHVYTCVFVLVFNFSSCPDSLHSSFALSCL